MAQGEVSQEEVIAFKATDPLANEVATIKEGPARGNDIRRGGEGWIGGSFSEKVRSLK